MSLAQIGYAGNWGNGYTTPDPIPVTAEVLIIPTITANPTKITFVQRDLDSIYLSVFNITDGIPLLTGYELTMGDNPFFELREQTLPPQSWNFVAGKEYKISIQGNPLSVLRVNSAYQTTNIEPLPAVSNMPGVVLFEVTPITSPEQVIGYIRPTNVTPASIATSTDIWMESTFHPPNPTDEYLVTSLTVWARATTAFTGIVNSLIDINGINVASPETTPIYSTTAISNSNYTTYALTFNLPSAVILRDGDVFRFTIINNTSTTLSYSTSIAVTATSYLNFTGCNKSTATYTNCMNFEISGRLNDDQDIEPPIDPNYPPAEIVTETDNRILIAIAAGLAGIALLYIFLAPAKRRKK